MTFAFDPDGNIPAAIADVIAEECEGMTDDEISERVTAFLAFVHERRPDWVWMLEEKRTLH